MTQRFNPPPGWQVPAGFTPTPGWQPDPSWPAAPANWNFWVDDASGHNQPDAYGTGQGYGHGQPGMTSPSAPAGAGAFDPAPATGAGAFQPAAPTGAGAFDPATATGAGAFDPSQAAGGASMALAEQQVKTQKRTMLIGFGIAFAAVLVTVISFAIAASSPTGGTWYFPWYFGLIGLAIGIRGAVLHNKAKKELSAAQAAAGGGLYGSGMGGTDLPGSGTNPNGDLYR